MRLRFNQLQDSFSRGLAPLYLICGDEPYQLGEAARLVREAARRQGFDEREVLDQDGSFDWHALAASADAMSLFSSRKLIELRIGTAKLGKEGGAAVRAYCARPCPDNLLLMIAPELDRKELQSQWAKQVESAGVLVQVWPLKGQELVAGLDSACRRSGFSLARVSPSSWPSAPRATCLRRCRRSRSSVFCETPDRSRSPTSSGILPTVPASTFFHSRMRLCPGIAPAPSG
jgi:DNA polymerase III delta subunit